MNEDDNQVDLETNPHEKTENDLKLDALTELLKETKESNEALKKELEEVKKVNAKMMVSLDISNRRDTNEDIYNLFDKYRKD